MIFLVGILVAIILTFCLAVFLGPPYLPTLNNQVRTALDFLDLKPGQVLLELGSGDGRVVKAAAARGLTVVGIEINPFLVVFSRFLCWRYRKQVTILWGDVWRIKWPQADGIFTFMLQRQMPKLDKEIQIWQRRDLRLASFAFFIPNRKPAAEKNGIFLYNYPYKLHKP